MCCAGSCAARCAMRIMLGAQDPVMHRLVPALVRQMGAAYPGTGPRAGADRGDAEAGGDALQADARPRAAAAGRRTGASARGRRAAGRGGVPALRHLRLPAGPDAGCAARKGPRGGCGGLRRRHGRSRRPRPAPPGPGSGETKDAAIWFDLARRRRARPSSWAMTPKRPRARSAPGPGRAPSRAAPTRARRCRSSSTRRPFYAESGGQVGDAGLIRTDTGVAAVTDTKKSAGVFIHIAQVTEGHDHQRPAREAGGRPHPPRGDPRQPLGHAPSARGAAARRWAITSRSAAA